MKTVDRKIIFECEVGSRLYGTNRPDSDHDYCGVFLPSNADLLGLGECPNEWTANQKLSNGPRNQQGDVDRKYFSLPKFLRLVLQGQSVPMEMLFAPWQSVVVQTKEWNAIKESSHQFFSKKSVIPFIAFAKSQAWKATCKGENLNELKNLLAVLDPLPTTMSIGEMLEVKSKEPAIQSLQRTTNHQGFDLVIVNTKMWDLGSTVKRMRTDLRRMADEYGRRSQATAEIGYDYKSLSHAYRLVIEAKEFLQTGAITLPLGAEDAEFIKLIRSGAYKANYFDELEQRFDEIKAIESQYPEKPDVAAAETLCREMLWNHLVKGDLSGT